MVLNYKKIFENFLIIFCAILTIYILYLLCKFSNYGFDLTDEGWYLNWISNPYIYKSSTSNFGFIYHPLFSFLNENLTYLRRANFLFSFILSYLLIFFLTKEIVSTKILKVNFLSHQVFLISLSTTIFFSVIIFSPSYNSLTIQGLMITSIGLLFLEKSNKKISTLFIISFGGWMVFMGKPSSAIILGLVTFVYLLIKKVSIRGFILCIFFSITLILITSFAIDNSPIIFFKRLLTDIEDLKLLEAGYSNKDIIKKSMTLIEQPESQNILAIYYSFGSICFLIFYFFILFFKINNKNYNYFLKLISLILLSIFIIYVYFYKNELLLIFERYQRLQILSILIFSSFFVIFINKFQIKKILYNLNFKLSLALFLMPLIYAFGSNINYFKKSLDLGFFYLLVSFLILLPSFLKKYNFNSIFPIVYIALLIVILHLNIVIEKPYRQIYSLKSNDYNFKLNKKNSTIMLNQEMATYINHVAKKTEDAGLISKSYILDLTGRSAGLIFLLGHISLGAPWMIGGYPGSFNYVKSKIKSETCLNISNSWILHDSNSRSISLDVLKSFGTNIETDYHLVASWITNGFKTRWKQKFFKPRNTEEIYQKCLKKFNNF